jgi:hypothetical protein
MTPSAPRALRQAWPVTLAVAGLAVWAAVPALGAMLGHGGPVTPDLYRPASSRFMANWSSLSMIVLAEHPVFMRRFTNTLALILIPALLLPCSRLTGCPFRPTTTGVSTPAFTTPMSAVSCHGGAGGDRCGHRSVSELAVAPHGSWPVHDDRRGPDGNGGWLHSSGHPITHGQRLVPGAEALLLAMALGLSKNGGPARWRRAACAVLLALAGTGAVIFVNRFELLASDN